MRQHVHPKNPAHQGIALDVLEMPYPCKPDEEQNQNPVHRVMVAVLWSSYRRHVETVEDLPELHRVHELRECQKAAEGREPFRAHVMGCIRPDFSGLPGISILSLIQACFRAILLLSFNHMG